MTSRTKKLITEYMEDTDWRGKENANTRKSISGMTTRISGQVIAEDNMERIPHGDLHDIGLLYAHDLTYPVETPYCAGHDLLEIMTKGITTAGGTRSLPAKHMDTAVDHIVNFLCMAQNECAGAQSFSNVSALLAPFVRVDRMNFASIKQNVQRMVFSLNYENRVAFQQSFTNFTLDWSPPEVFRNMPAIVGGKPQDFLYDDLQREIDLVNLAFLEVYYEGDGGGKPFSFPIPTVQVVDDKIFEDNDVNNLFWKLVAKWGTPYFSNFVGTDLDPAATRSMCCVTPDTKLFVQTSKGCRVRTAKAIFESSNSSFRLLHDGKWNDANIAKVKDDGHYEFTLTNNQTIRLTKTHTCLVCRQNDEPKLIPASDVDDYCYMPMNTEAIKGSHMGDYDLGYLIGLYIGDGCVCNGNNITICLNPEQQDIATRVAYYVEKRFGSTCSIDIEKNVLFLRIFDKALLSIVDKYIDITLHATEKKMTNRVFMSSLEFRQGVYDGMMDSDGARGSISKDRYYTASEGLIEDFIALCTSLGKVTYKEKPDTREGRLGTNPVYCARTYRGRKSYTDRFFTDEFGTIWFRVRKVDWVNNPNGTYYDFEVDSPEHLFTLANGIVTHNCRLNLSAEEAEQPHGLWAIGSKTGSLAVSTVNLCMLGAMAEDEKDFMAKLADLMEKAREQLRYRRNRIEEGRRAGLMPIFSEYVGTPRSFFLTIGICGMHECCMNLFDKPISECEEFVLGVLDFMKKRIRTWKEEDGFLYNFEQTPAETASFVMAKKTLAKFPNAFVSKGASDIPFITNSTHEPMYNGRTLPQRLEWASKTDQFYTGGTIMHVWLHEQPNVASVKKLVKAILQYNIPYFTITPTITHCADCGQITYGVAEKCKHCKSTNVESLTRVVGYYSPMSRYNPGQYEQHGVKKAFDQDVEGIINAD